MNTIATQTTELLVIDPAVGNAPVLLDGRRADIEILQITSNGSGLKQIAAYLQGRHGISTLHILCHGEPGALLLAGEKIDKPALETQCPALTEIADALAPDATVLLYGCSVAAERAGRQFIDHLEASLGVTVASSSGPVGSAALGGDWTLQSQHGISNNLAFTAVARASYAGLLATETLTVGDDTPALSAGDDTVTVDTTNALGAGDVIDGQDGADRLEISAAQTVVLGAATLTNVETIAITAGVQNITTNDATVAAAQTLTVDASASISALTWDGLAETDGVFSITGGSGKDLIKTGAGNDTIHGGAGNDTLSGGDGADGLYGDENNDTVYGGAGVDTLSGGDGNDFMYAGTEADLIYGNAGNDGISGDAGNDSIWGGDGNDTMIGGNGDDSISGGEGNDWLWGQADNDILYGDAGNDTISGNDGNDTLFGGIGDDTLSGAAGTDTLHGEAGNDVFSASAADFNGDTISDFATGDSIVVVGTDLSALNGTAASGTITVGTEQTLTLTGISAASGTFAASYSGSNTTITLNAAPPNNAPVIGSDGGGATAAVNAAENQTAVTTVTATDADNDTLTFSITGGADQAKFSINAGTGALSFSSAPDFEAPADSDTNNTYVVEVTASDGNGGTDIQTVTVTVTDVNETPPPVDDTPAPPPVITSTVDGTSVQSQNTVNSQTGMTQQTIIVPVISPTRNEDQTTSNTTLADIPLGATGTTTRAAVDLTVSLPTGAGMTATGTATPLAGQQAVLDLIGRIEQVTTSGSSTRDEMTGEGSGFLQSLGDRSLLTRTVVPTATTGSGGSVNPTEPLTIVISGGTGSVVVQDPESPTTASAVGLVIDTRQLPDQSVIQLDNVEFAAIIGATTVIGGDGENYVVGDDANQSIVLGAGDDTLSGGAGDDTVGSAGGNDRIFGDAGNDIVFGGEGNDLIDGGADRDILQLSGAGRADYAMRIEEGKLVITHHGSDGVDTVTDVEAIRFTGSGPDLSADGTLTRLYDAAFDRTPDEDGKAYWLNESSSGMSMHDIATVFLASNEPEQSSETMSNAQFVDQLYQFALGRSADSSGRSYWLDMLDSGQADRANVLLAFVNSEEKLALEPVVPVDLDFNQSDIATLVRMYDTLFNRRPDQDGINYWIQANEAGMAMSDIASAFVAAGEVQYLYSAMSNEQYIAMLYKTGLGRDGSTEEIAEWARQLDNGLSRGEVLLSFADSAEKIGLVGGISTSIETI